MKILKHAVKGNHALIQAYCNHSSDAGFPTGVKNIEGGGGGGVGGGLSQCMGGASKERENILLLSLTQKNICNLIG